MPKKVYVTNAQDDAAPARPKRPSVTVQVMSTTRHAGSNLRARRTPLIIWLGAVLGPFLLQFNSYVQLVTPHKISQNLLALDLQEEDGDVLANCPIRGIFIAGVWWNIGPSQYYATASGRICRFVVPQYNMHGAYHFAPSEPMAPISSCSTERFAVNYYFYHGSIGYYSFYEEGDGYFCTDDMTAVIKVTKLGSYDMNGQILADDRGTTGYRSSYWFGVVGLSWIIFRALVLRRSFIVFMRHINRCLDRHEHLQIRDAIIYIQESARLSAHGANNLHRLALLYLLLEGFMADLFLFITKEQIAALTQCISLTYNLAGIVSILFEMVETSKFLGRRVQSVKRWLFNNEMTMIGEVLVVSVLQMYLTKLNRSKFNETKSVAQSVSYYAWGLLAHAFIATTMVLFLFIVRSTGAAIIVHVKYGALAPLTAPSCVETVLGARQKLILLMGYRWSDGKLYYEQTTLRAYGLLVTVNDEGDEFCLVQEKIYWFTAPVHALTSVGRIDGKHVEWCADQPCTCQVTPCDRVLGGLESIDGADDPGASDGRYRSWYCARTLDGVTEDTAALLSV